jgi:hypothetical protein
MIEEKRKVPNLTRYELIDKNGRVVGSFNTANSAGEFAKRTWPDQEQDEDRTGNGWDVQVVGCDS